MSNAVQFMNGKSLGIGAFLPSTIGERFNAVERSKEEHEAAVLLMCERFEKRQDLFSGEYLDYLAEVAEWNTPEESEENDELELDD